MMEETADNGDDNKMETNQETEKMDIEAIKEQWLKEQDSIKLRITTFDDRDWDVSEDVLVGGLDISFIVGDDVNACACYVVINQLFQPLYSKTTMVKMTAPYIPGFLAFREADFLCDLVREQIREKPEVTPAVLMVDGNGILHPNRAGVASHIGVVLGIPTIGVAKNLHRLPELGDISKMTIAQHLNQKGDIYELAAGSELLGMAVKTCSTGLNPVFVSVGSGISLQTAVKLTLAFSKYRIPEPTRQADITSREFLRVHHPTARQLQPSKQQKKQKKNHVNSSEMENKDLDGTYKT